MCEKPEAKLIENIQEGRQFEVRASTALRYEIRAGGNVYSVNLEDNHRSCSCGKWRIEGIPCSHACAAISRARLNAYQMCDPCFSTAAYREVYKESIKPVPTSDRPDIESAPQEEQIRPPVTRAMLGRRKKKRYRKRVHTYSITCSRCGGKGHNRRRCNIPIAEV
jgi:zinc finger SWIM domain-containing protein 3